MQQAQTLSEDLQARIVRYAELRPQRQAYIDRRTPGNTDQETFSVIGRGLVESERARNQAHITTPHGFFMGGARQAPGCTNSQHAHETLETFLVHGGSFTFYLGPNCEDGEIRVLAGDVISIPVHVFRGFRNTGDGVGHLASAIAGPDPGRVTWAPYVFETAREHGLVMLDNGDLVDTAAGESVPEGAALFPPTTDEDVARFRRLRAEEMTGCVARHADLSPATQGLLTRPGVDECPVIGVANAAEGMPAAPIPAAHGFQVRRLRMAPGARIPAHARAEVEVVFVHHGNVTIAIDGTVVALGKGDYFSLPIGAGRAWRNDGEHTNELHVVRGGDHPAPPRWVDRPG